jgi:hypothetical protein
VHPDEQHLVRDGYCNPEVNTLIERQSREGDPDRRKQLLWEIERKLAEDVARPERVGGREERLPDHRGHEAVHRESYHSSRLPTSAAPMF